MRKKQNEKHFYFPTVLPWGFLCAEISEYSFFLPTYKKIECAMLFQNIINRKSIALGQSMEEIKREVEYQKDKVQVILQFPEMSEEMDQIKNEVKEILKRELQKQIKDRKGVV